MNCHGHYWCCFHYFKKLWILCCLHKYESWFHFMLFGKVEGRSLLCLIRLNLLLFCGKLSSVQFSRSVVSDSLWPHELQHARPLCPSPTPGVHPNSRPSSWWCHPAISSSVVPFSSCPQSLPAPGSFPMSQLFNEFQLQRWSFQWTPGTDLLKDGLAGSPFSPRDSQESSPTPQFKSINFLALSFLYFFLFIYLFF